MLPGTTLMKPNRHRNSPRTGAAGCDGPELPSGKWIEWIRVRSSKDALQRVMHSLRSQLEALTASTSSAETFLLQHAMYEGDLALVIVWRTDDPPRKSREGLAIAERLEENGTVDHAVWRQTTPLWGSPQ
ncbi:hypothetical protein ABI59_09385 [Acidobacteria bacterium Mor1]|nr:hypothetical protein ABI59_09385 [Acidobacteria bacterium Mor1]